MENKKGSSLVNIFVYLLIFILIVLIILPPVTRIFLKEDTTSSSNNNRNNSTNTVKTTTALTCRKEVTVGTMIYNVTITSNYGNDILNKVTFNYSLPTTPDPTVTDNPVETEINTLRSTGLLEETATDTAITFVLTKENKEANPTNTALDSYFQPLDTQTTNLEALGYTCSSISA